MLIRALLETTGDLLKKFEVMYHNLPDKRAKIVQKALQDLEKALSSGIIYNVTFNEIKSSLSRALESSLEVLENVDFENFRETVLRRHHDITTYVQMNQTGKQIKVIMKALEDENHSREVVKSLEEMLKVNEAAAEIKKLLDELKPKIIKGRQPSTNVDTNAFVSKLGSKEAQKIVVDAIKEEITKQLDEYEKGVKDYLQSGIDDLKAIGELSYIDPSDVGIKLMLAQKCFTYNVEKPLFKDRHTKPIKLLNLKINERGKKFAAEEAKEARDGLERQFLAKNTKKLSHIVELKGNLNKIETMSSKPVQIRAGSGTLEVGFHFKFTDGSEFKVINKIVTKYSYTGTRFEQFPTTFHDVIFPDKTKMKMPSEEKMIKDFGNRMK